ncbi:hypothetical protein [Serinicoccus sp. CUA-874]|uniref:hypothetical protein n=1 Tax=Serinicoccus sp. CUA-874 TaxID=1517939 RepID=UPI001EDC36FB|nr:hypothetical protein [Serinicoccus sp. CUA-874]
MLYLAEDQLAPELVGRGRRPFLGDPVLRSGISWLDHALLRHDLVDAESCLARTRSVLTC